MAPRSRRPAEVAPDVEYRSGVHLAGTILWCDPSAGRSLCFLSRADVRPPPSTKGILCSEMTRSLRHALSAASGTKRAERAELEEALAPPIGRPFSLGPLRLEILPGGLVPGAASLSVTREDGRRLLYATAASPDGDRTARLAESAHPRACDAIVLEAALPSAIELPPRAAALAAIEELIDEAASVGRGALLLVESVATGLELCSALARPERRLRLDAPLARWVKACRSIGISLPPPVLLASRALAPSEVAVAIVGRRAPDAARVALIGGEAADPARRAAAGAETGIVFDAHPDATSLLRYVEACHATHVYVVGRHRVDLAARLTAPGRVARAIGPPSQLALL